MENVENEVNVSNEDQSQKVKRMLELMSQREHLDEEISKLRAEINASIAANRKQTEVVTPPPFNPVTETVEPKDTVAPQEPVAPPPFVLPPPIPSTPKVSESSNSERNIGVKWMAITGIFIAVLGLILCIKILLDKNLIGSVGRVILGYLGSAAMVVGAFKVPSTRKVLKDTLLFGGANLGYAVTWLAYGYFDLFSSPVTLAILWTITSALLAFSYIHDNKLLFSYALFWFVMSPFCAGYSFDSHINRTVFWMVFLVVVNVALCFVYKIKKWTPVYASAFVATGLVLIIMFFDGADLSHSINVLYFAILCAVFYAGDVVLYLNREKYNFDFIAFTVINFLTFAIFTAIEFHNRHSIAHTYIYISLALCATAFVFQKLLPERKLLFTTPFSYALIFTNLALIINYVLEYSQWFPLVFAIEILAAAFVYKYTQLNYFKLVALLLTYLSFVVVCIAIPIIDFHYSLPDNYWIVLNTAFITKLAYIAVLVFILKAVVDKFHKASVSLLLYLTVAFVVAHELLIYWIFVDSRFTDSQEFDLSCVSLTIWFGLLSVAAALMPKKLEFLSNIKTIGYTLLPINLLSMCILFCTSMEDLQTLSSKWYFMCRYFTLAVAIGMAAFAIFNRKYPLCKNFDKIIDIVVAFTMVWIVGSEITNILTLLHSQNSYGILLTAWLGVASLILFVIGFKFELKHLRIFGFVLSAQTVVKLFFYDIWNSELWIKALVFVAVGVTFLIVSYIYSKYFKKEKLQDDEQTLGTE